MNGSEVTMVDACWFAANTWDRSSIEFSLSAFLPWISPWYCCGVEYGMIMFYWIWWEFRLPFIPFMFFMAPGGRDCELYCMSDGLSWPCGSIL